jgi:hypothetical protein
VDAYQQMALEGAVARLDDVLAIIPASAYKKSCAEIEAFLGCQPHDRENPLALAMGRKAGI